MQPAIVSSNRATVAVEKFADRICRQRAVLEGTRNSLAHQRIDPGSIAGKHDASARIAVARVEPPNRERMPSRRAPLQAVEQKFGKSRDEFCDHPPLFSALVFQFAGALIVDAHVEMRCASDEAGERPTVAVDSAAYASKVKAVALLDKFRRAFGIDRDVGHQCAPDCFFPRTKDPATDPAARSVR